MVKGNLPCQIPEAALFQSKDDHGIGGGPYRACPIAAHGVIPFLVGCQHRNPVGTLEGLFVLQPCRQPLLLFLVCGAGNQRPECRRGFHAALFFLKGHIIEEAVFLIPHIFLDSLNSFLFILLKECFPLIPILYGHSVRLQYLHHVKKVIGKQHHLAGGVHAESQIFIAGRIVHACPVRHIQAVLMAHMMPECLIILVQRLPHQL